MALREPLDRDIRGVTLVELIVGLGIGTGLVLGMTTFMTNMSSSADASQVATSRDEIVRLLRRNIMNPQSWKNTVAHSPPLASCTGQQSGNFNCSNGQWLPLAIYDSAPLADSRIISGPAGMVGMPAPDNVDHPAAFSDKGAPACVSSVSQTCPIQVTTLFRPSCPPQFYFKNSLGFNSGCFQAEFVTILYRITMSADREGRDYYRSISGSIYKSGLDGELNPP